MHGGTGQTDSLDALDTQVHTNLIQGPVQKIVTVAADTGNTVPRRIAVLWQHGKAVAKLWTVRASVGNLGRQ